MVNTYSNILVFRGPNVLYLTTDNLNQHPGTIDCFRRWADPGRHMGPMDTAYGLLQDFFNFDVNNLTYIGNSSIPSYDNITVDNYYAVNLPVAMSRYINELPVSMASRLRRIHPDEIIDKPTKASDVCLDRYHLASWVYTATHTLNFEECCTILPPAGKG